MTAAILLAACASGDGPGAPLRLEAFTPSHASFRAPFDLELTGEGFVEPVRVRLGDTPGELLSRRDDRLLVRFPALGSPARLRVTVEAGGAEVESSEPLIVRGMAPEALRFFPAGELEGTARQVRAWRHRGLLRLVVVEGGGLRWLEPDAPFSFTTIATLEAEVDTLEVLDEAAFAVVDGALERLTAGQDGLTRTPVEGVSDVEAIGVDHDTGRATVVGRDAASRRWLFSVGLSTAQPAFPLDGFAVASLSLGDADGDGHLDALLGGRDGGPRLLLGDGHGAFREAPPDLLPPVGAGVASFVDANVDGELDVVVSTSGEDRVLLGGTRFVDRTEAVLGGSSGSNALWADLDADGALDRLESAPARLLRNDGTGRFFDYTSRALPSAIDLHRVLSAVDLDEDGDLDLVVAGSTGALALLENRAPKAWLDTDEDGIPDDLDECDACEEAP